MTDLLWQPSDQQIAQANITRFIAEVNQAYNLHITNYEELHQWSIDHMEDFWRYFWKFSNVISKTQGDVFATSLQDFINTRFFPEAKLNFAENLLRRKDDEKALIFWVENGLKRSLTFKELYDQVSQVVQFLQQSGIQKGDRIAAMMPNMPETIVLSLATATIGATWASCSPDFGVEGTVDRFAQIMPRIFIGCDQYFYKGKAFNCTDKLADIVAKIPSIERVILVNFLEDQPQPCSIPNTVTLTEILQAFAPESIQFEAFDFNQPLYIMFSSGTTGTPKCIVHGAGGTLLQHLKEHQLHCDIKPNNRVFYFSTCGWMMWNWHVTALASGATLLLYEGSPLYPKNDILFDFAEAEKMTLFGTSSKYIDMVRKFNVTPKATHNLDALRMFTSTAGPLVAESFDYVYQNVKADLCLASISGGTDIVSCFVLGNPIGPIYSGQIQARGLGMAVDVFDNEGNSLREEKGELVCCKPFPSKPLGFWGDDSQEKFKETYFSRYPNIWNHGDFVEITAQGGLVIYGRSDTVLNPGGVRIGTAEIYRQVEKIDGILDSLAIGQEWDKDVRVVLFVVLKETLQLTADFAKHIKDVIRANTTPRHVPAEIVAIPDLPRTKSGKLAELAVRDIVHNRPVNNAHALANPNCLKAFENIPQLQTA